MQGQQQHMVIVAKNHQAPTNQRSARQVERCRGFALDQRLEGLPGLGMAAQILDMQLQPGPDRFDQHLRHFIMLDKTAAQGFVTRNDPRQRPLQRHSVKLATQAQGDGNVVGGIGALDLCQEPQALLGERQRQRLVAGHRQQGRQGAVPGGFQNPRHGRQLGIGE